MNKRFLKFLKITGVVLLVIYAGICTLLYAYQDDLLFYPQKKTVSEINELMASHPGFDTLHLVMKDGSHVIGYISKDSVIQKTPLVIYFGGNAEEVGHLMDKKPYFPKAKLALINYRGYGLSEGIVSQQNMFSDALEVYDDLKHNPSVDTNAIFVLGRSIGTGVATYLSSQRPVKGTALITPYESMISVASEKYPFVPISLLIKHPFNSQEYAANINTKMLALIAKRDDVVPAPHAHRLLKSWKGKTSYLEVDEDHGTIMNNNECWKCVQKFVEEGD